VISVAIAIAPGVGREAVAPSLHLHDQQLLLAGGLPLRVQPPSAQAQAKLAGPRARALDAVDRKRT
jgi:hypothetical protein